MTARQQPRCSVCSVRVRATTAMFGPLHALPVLALLAAVSGGECPSEREQPLHDEARLHEDLLCAYKPDFRPVKDHNTAVTVKVRFALKYMSFDMQEETFTVHSWVAMTWKDEFLTWTPSDYGNIKETQLESHEIWAPRMALFNADASQYDSYGDTLFTTCLVASDGTVTCVPHVAHAGICRTSLRRWPYDVQNCTLYFGSWMHTGEQVNFTFYEKRPVVMEDFQDGPGWKLLHVYNKRLPTKYNNTTYPMLRYTFELKREAAGPAAIVVVPSVIVMALTLTALLLDIKDNTRLMLACFSLFGHFIFLTEIGYDIPKHSFETPVILLFIRDSMVVTLVSVVMTLVLMSLRRRTQPAPAWAAAAARLAVTGPGKYVVFTEFDPTDVELDKKGLTEEGTSNDTSTVTSDWIQFANLLNSLLFIVSFLVYVILLSIYIPYDD